MLCMWDRAQTTFQTQVMMKVPLLCILFFGYHVIRQSMICAITGNQDKTTYSNLTSKNFGETTRFLLSMKTQTASTHRAF